MDGHTTLQYSVHPINSSHGIGAGGGPQVTPTPTFASCTVLAPGPFKKHPTTMALVGEYTCPMYSAHEPSYGMSADVHVTIDSVAPAPNSQVRVVKSDRGAIPR